MRVDEDPGYVWLGDVEGDQEDEAGDGYRCYTIFIRVSQVTEWTTLETNVQDAHEEDTRERDLLPQFKVQPPNGWEGGQHEEDVGDDVGGRVAVEELVAIDGALGGYGFIPEALERAALCHHDDEL